MSVSRTEFIHTYANLVKLGRWEDVMEFVRLHINDAKTVLVSADPNDYKELHEALAAAEHVQN